MLFINAIETKSIGLFQSRQLHIKYFLVLVIVMLLSILLMFLFGHLLSQPEFLKYLTAVALHTRYSFISRFSFLNSTDR